MGRLLSGILKYSSTVSRLRIAHTHDDDDYIVVREKSRKRACQASGVESACTGAMVYAHSRRAFLARTLGAAWIGASFLERASLLAADARAQSNQPLPVLFDIEKVADGV